jgi:signal transduction histidine kinase
MLTNLETALRQTIRVVRDLTGEQLPAVLKTFGIGGALRQLANDPGTPIELTVTGEEPDLTLSQRLCLHHVISAVIGRIRAHASASHIEVIGMFEPSRLEILIEHDGADVMRAVAPDDAALATIKGRISHLGGRLLLSRSSGDGTCRARLVLPLPITKADISPQTPQPA